MFEKNVVMGDWEFPLIYGFKPEEWSGLLDRFRTSVDGWRQGERAGPRVLVEVR